MVHIRKKFDNPITFFREIHHEFSFEGRYNYLWSGRGLIGVVFFLKFLWLILLLIYCWAKFPQKTIKSHFYNFSYRIGDSHVFFNCCWGNCLKRYIAYRITFKGNPFRRWIDFIFLQKCLAEQWINAKYRRKDRKSEALIWIFKIHIYICRLLVIIKR